MKKKIPLLLLVFLAFSHLKAQNLQSQLNKFDSLNGLQDKASKAVLDDLVKSDDFKNNDTVRARVYSAFSKYYITTADDITFAEKYTDSCLHYALKLKNYSIASVCLHNQAVGYHYKNKIDTAISVENRALEYAKIANDNKNYYVSLMAIARRYYYLGKYKESNDLIIGNLDTIEDKETKAVALTLLASNYRNLGSKVELDTYFLEAISNLKEVNHKRLLSSVILEYCNYLMDKNEYKKVIAYADSINIYSNLHYSKTTAV